MHIPDILEIVIGQTTSQDLLLDLGPPVRRYWKEDDRMERMWGSGQTGTQAGSCELCASLRIETDKRRFLELLPARS